MTIAILYSPNKTNWMISAVLIFVPYAFVRSLNFVIIFGKAMDIQDRDLVDALTCGMAPPEPIRLKKKDFLTGPDEAALIPGFIEAKNEIKPMKWLFCLWER